MIRKFVASKKTILHLLNFSRGGRRYSSVLGPKFPLKDSEKTRFNWQSWSKTRFSDLLLQSKNHENILHDGKALQVDISLGDEFAELGPSVTSLHKLDSETKDSTERAPKAGGVTIEDSTLFINDRKAPEVFKIRIKDPVMEISEVAIHGICSSHGPVSSLVRTKDGAIDVLFSVNNKSEAQIIVNKLNSITVNGIHVSAELLPSETSSESSCKNSVDSRFDELTGSFRKQLELQRIYLEDLEHLHRAVLHLKRTQLKIISSPVNFCSF